MIRFLLILVVFASTVLQAQTAITFDTLNDGDLVTTQYSGVTFSNAQVLKSGFSLNDLDFPAHSGANAITVTIRSNLYYVFCSGFHLFRILYSRKAHHRHRI